MLTTLDDLLDRAPVDDITAKAREIRFTAAVLTVLRALLALTGGALYGIGWLAFKALAGAWFILAWAFAAVSTGWVEAGGPVRKPKADSEPA